MKKLLTALTAVFLICAVALGACAETFTFSLIGDCTVGDQYKYRGYASTMTYRLDQEGYDWPFLNVKEMFAQDDLTLANCEGVFSSRYPGKNMKFMTLGADPKYAQAFKLGNVDVVNTANNHAKDYGVNGRQDTFDTFAELGIGAFGDEVTYECTVKGVKIGFVGYTYPINEGKLKKYTAAIQTLREDGCTFVVASVHWGKEEGTIINGDQRKYGTKLIDAGADMVFGHGSHTLLPIQIYEGKAIFYSLSNFCFGANAAPEDDDTAVVQVTYDIQPDGTMTLGELTAIPFKMHKDKNYQPYAIEDQEGKEQCWYKLYFHREKDPDSGLPESFLTTGYADLRSTDVGEWVAEEAE